VRKKLLIFSKFLISSLNREEKRLVFVGQNGIGKTTLLKIILVISFFLLPELFGIG